MNKLWLIIKREYLTRVTKKTFLLATLGTPLAIILFLGAEVFFLSYESEGNKIAVIDDSGLIKDSGKALPDSKSVKFILSNEPVEKLKETYKEQKFNGVLHIPEKVGTSDKNSQKVNYYSEDKLGIVSKKYIESKVAKRWKEHRVQASGYDKKVLDGFDAEIKLNQKTIEGGEDEKSFSAEMASGLGIIVGYIMLMVVMIYGSMVMRSVMEEKTTRIVEVIISSVKPFQLMLGKIIGVGMVGLTQLGIWAILIPAIFMLYTMFGMNPADAAGEEGFSHIFQKVVNELSALNWWVIMPVILLFFLGGYFLYSAMFAALGSAVGDDDAEAQSLSLPVSMLLMLGFFLMFASVRNPNSGMAFWSSLIPFFSPILIPARMAFNPPWWEIVLSLVILFGTAVFFTWLAARIYRIGILMYGKKASFKDISKWIFTTDH